MTPPTATSTTQPPPVMGWGDALSVATHPAARMLAVLAGAVLTLRGLHHNPAPASVPVTEATLVVMTVFTATLVTITAMSTAFLMAASRLRLLTATLVDRLVGPHLYRHAVRNGTATYTEKVRAAHNGWTSR